MNTIRTLKRRESIRLAGTVLAAWGLISTAGLSSAQILDTNFGPNVAPAAIAIQPDGRVLVGQWNSFQRLQWDGSHDWFGSGLYSFTTALIVEADGQILVGADYEQGSYGNLARVDPGVSAIPIYAGMSGAIYSAALQPDGRILAAGVGNGPALTNRIVRLNPDGTTDTNFNAFASYTVFNLTVQPDGKILVGGFFGLLNGHDQQIIIGRLNSDGSLDTSFASSPIGYINGSVQTMVLQPDGKILIGGYFMAIGGQTRNRIARLNPDGTVDTTFDAGDLSGSGNNVSSLALQANGKILVAGDFTTLAGHACTNVGRLNPDGSFDASFEGSVSETWANAVTLHPDGSILVAAEIATPGGQFIPFARFINTDPATNSLTRSGSTLTWSRGGAVPEVWRTTFEASTNGGASWLFLGDGTRIAGGWQLTNVSAPANATVRARGYYTTGRFNASSSIDEKVIGPPVVVSHPREQYAYFGESVRFFGAAGGTEPLSYQWRRNGTNFTEGGDITGTHAQSLSVSNLFAGRDQADYSFVASNHFGSITSRLASLTVYEPIILSNYTSHYRIMPGQTATFSVTVGGTPPLHFQWRKDGTNIVGATQSSLVISNVQFSDAGNYDVAVSNTFGVRESTWSSLVVTFAEPDSLVTISNWWYNSDDHGFIKCVVPLPDGKLLVGGEFVSLGGHNCTNLARINLDGSVDTSFNPNPTRSDWLNGLVEKLAVQVDGRIVVKGDFDTIAGVARTNLARLNPDGSVDSSFNPSVTASLGALAVQPDGRILVTADVAGTNCLLRLNPDGTTDFSLAAPVIEETWSGNVSTLALTDEGKILVGGTFDHIAGQPRANFARFNANGTLDSWTITNLARSPLVVQRDGKILMGAFFHDHNGSVSGFGLVRFDTNGIADSSFSPIMITPLLLHYSLALQSDGKILVGSGSYLLQRFNTDGSEDPGFNVNLNGQVDQVHFAADGKVLIQGSFTSVNGQPRAGFCRLFNDPATKELDPGSSVLTWWRGGSSPEVWRTTFDYSTNGSTWLSLGDGIRIDGGWQASSLGLPANSTLRARGFVNGGGNQWLVEEILPVGVALFPANSGTNPFGFLTRVVPGQSLVIEASTNLVNWIPIHTNPPKATNLIHFSDPDFGQFPQRFFRAHAP